MAPLPLEELQQLSAVFGLIKSDYVEPVDEKKLISDAITGMVASLDPHSQYYDKKTFKEFREGTTGRFVGVAPAEVDADFDFEQTLRDIHLELADLNCEAVDLAARIQTNFEALGV